MSEFFYGKKLKKEKKVEIFNPEEFAEELEFESIDDRILDQIDESDLPIPANFVEFVTSKKFLGTTVFPRQIQIASQFYGEMCPDCSNKEMLDNLYDQDLDNIYDNIVFLRYGKCPVCGKTKIDFIKEGKYTFPDSLFVCCGQRCVTGDTVVYTKQGLRRINQFSTNISGFSDCEVSLFDGEKYNKSTHFFESYEESTKRIQGKFGTVIEGTFEHPIVVFKNSRLRFNKLSNIHEGNYILFKFGHNIWAKKEVVFSDFDTYYKDRFGKKDNCNIPKVADRNFCEWLGWFISEGFIHRKMTYLTISGNSFYREKLINLTKKVFGKNIRVENEKDLTIRSKKLCSFLMSLGIGLKSSNLRVPNCILNNTKENVCSFLRSYFEGDGGLEDRSISCASISEKLIDDIRILLSNIGIFSIKYDKFMEKHNYYAYKLVISSPKYLRLFKSDVGFISNRKKKALEKSISWYESSRERQATFSDSSLKPLDELFVLSYKRVLKELKKKHISITSILGRSYLDIVKRIGKDISLRRNVLIKFLNAIDSLDFKFSVKLAKRIKFLNLFRDENVILEQVKSVSYGYAKTYDFHIPSTHRFLTNNFVSHNSGKSILGGGLIPHYHTARILCMQNKKGKRVIPYRYFHNPPAPFYGTFTAVTLGQAFDNLWQPFKGYLDSPWWKLYFEILDYYGKKFGVELYKNNTTYLQFQHKKLAWLCEQPSKKKLRGKTRFFFGIDELSWHDLGTSEDSKLGSAKEVMASGRNSLLTFRNKANQKLLKGNFNIPTAIECYCSSPAEANDILMRKVRESKRNPKMLGYRYATWEFNPDYRGPEDIGESDPMILARDFGASPPLGDKQFYSDSKTLVEMIGNKIGMVNYSVQESKNDFGEVSLYPKIETLNYINTYPKILTLDNGQVNNCFAATLQHIENGIVVNDSIFSVRPTKVNKVNLSKCFDEFVLKLVTNKQLNIVMVAYDRWNSAQAVEKLKDTGVLAVQYSLKYQDFLDIRNNFATKSFVFNKTIMTNPNNLIDYEGDFDFVEASYKDNYFGLLYQILTVRDLGKMLAKPTTGDDDIFRAWSLGATLLRKDDYKDKFISSGGSYKTKRALGSVYTHNGARPNVKPNSSLGSIVHRKYH